ncbi:MAG: hypothetical protein EAZ43_02375 [Betaproteobacteria bacterium]|nr:MAG: hypothetical protein EAZ43_02375 [Betaproteobacteria bacterium]
MFQVVDFAHLNMDYRPSAARFILSWSLGGNDNLIPFFEARVVVQSALNVARQLTPCCCLSFAERCNPWSVGGGSDV